MATVYFFVMQPVVSMRLSSRINDRKTKSHFETKKYLLFLTGSKYLVLTAIVGLVWAAIKVSIARPFRDSVTDATNGVGQLLMTRLYHEQWIF